jgi:tellurite resistance protein TehA-like permease
MAKTKDPKVELQRFVIYFMVRLFAIQSLSAIVFLYLEGGGHLHLPSGALMSLLASTFGQGAATFVLVVKYVFRRDMVCACQEESSPLASSTLSDTRESAPGPTGLSDNQRHLRARQHQA